MSNFAHPSTTQGEHQKTGASPVIPAQTRHQPQFVIGTDKGLVLLDSECRVELQERSITALAASPSGWWVITDHHSIWQRNSNNQWHNVADVSDMELNCLLPFKEAILVGTSAACLLQIQDGNLQRLNCFESVEGHDEWYTPWGAPPDVRSLAVSSAGTLYVNVHVGGILRSDDQGRTWQPTIDFHADVHEVCTIADRPDWVLAATAQGLAISQDKGNTWHFDRQNLHGAYTRAVAVCGETILITASTGPHTGKAAIYRRSLDQADGFEKCEQGLPEWFASNINTGTLATAEQLAAFGTREGKLFLSRDAGQSWQNVATDLTTIRCLELAL